MKSPLTPEQRFDCYQRAIKHIEKEGGIYVCILLDEIFEDIYDYNIAHYNCKESFPEFYNQKPEDANSEGGWWPLFEKEPRISALKKASDEVYNLIQKG